MTEEEIEKWLSTCPPDKVKVVKEALEMVKNIQIKNNKKLKVLKDVSKLLIAALLTIKGYKHKKCNIIVEEVMDEVNKMLSDANERI